MIAFLGLLAPHIGRRLVGGDHRFLIPHSCIIGSLLLLVADTVSRTLVGSGTLPVGVLTSFMGAPLFLYLLVRGHDSVILSVNGISFRYNSHPVLQDVTFELPSGQILGVLGVNGAGQINTVEVY